MGGWVDRWMDMHIEGQKDKHTGGLTERQTLRRHKSLSDRRTDRTIYLEMDEQMDGHANRNRDKHTDRLTERQTDTKKTKVCHTDRQIER